MLLFEPSPGQLVDRMTILRVKRVKGNPTETQVLALELELARCEEALLRWWYGVERNGNPEGLSRLVVWLHDRNERQWELEDNVRRALRLFHAGDASYGRLLEIAQIESKNAQGNEDRARLVREIDDLFAVTPEVKKYD